MLPFLHSNVLLSRWCQRKFPLLLRLTCACNGYILDIRRATTPSQWRRGAATPRFYFVFVRKNSALVDASLRFLRCYVRFLPVIQDVNPAVYVISDCYSVYFVLV